jgi:hypothetical protein
MVKPQVNMLSTGISHTPLLFVWRDSGVTHQHGFELHVDVTSVKIPGQAYIGSADRAKVLLDGTYDFLSGLHHEPYVYRARGDKRFVYLAQAQNDWDDRVIATQEVKSVEDLNGKKIAVANTAPCVYGNLRHSLEMGGVNLDSVEWVFVSRGDGGGYGNAVEALARGEAVAAQVDAPFDLQGEKQGMHRLDVPSVPVIHNVTVNANREWVAENEETTSAFLRSMVDAIHFFKTEKQKTCEIIEREIAPISGIGGPDEIEHLWKTWAGLLSPKPFPHPLAVWNVYNLDVAHDPRVNFVGPFEPWDTSILRDIDDSGYIDELYGGPEAAANPAVNVAI